MKKITYNVFVKDDREKSFSYTITVSGRTDSKQNDCNTKECTKLDRKPSEEANILSLLVESSRYEYEHSFRRAERLDNKAYILLTVCAFVYAALFNSINFLSDIDKDGICFLSFSFLYIVLLFICIFLNIFTLGLLIYSLSGKNFKTYDTSNILEYNLFSNYDYKTISRYTVMKYEKARDYNNEIVTNKFKKVNIAVKLLVVDVIVLITVMIIGNAI